MENPLSLPFSLLPSVPFSSPSSFSGSLTEKLIEGQKSPDTSLLLPDLLTLTDSFNTAAESTTNGTSYVLVPCFAPKNSSFALHMSSFPFFSLTSLQSQAYHLGKEERRCSSFFSVLLITSLYYRFTLCLCSKGRGVCGLTDSWFGGSPAPETFGPARAHSCQCARLASWTSE